MVAISFGLKNVHQVRLSCNPVTSNAYRSTTSRTSGIKIEVSFYYLDSVVLIERCVIAGMASEKKKIGCWNDLFGPVDIFPYWVEAALVVSTSYSSRWEKTLLRTRKDAVTYQQQSQHLLVWMALLQVS